MAGDLIPATSTCTEQSIEVVAQELNHTNADTQHDTGSFSSGSRAIGSSASALQQQQQQQQQQTRFSFYEPEPEVQEEPTSTNANRFNFYTGTGIISNNTSTAAASTTDKYKDKPTTKSSTSGNSKREELAAVDNIHVDIDKVTTLSTDSSTDDILRSLQETEEQRVQLLSATPTANNNTYTKGRTTSSSNVNNNNNNNYALPQSQDEETSKQQQQHTNTNEASASTITSNTNSNGNTNISNSEESINPYEDAIKEALDLLRKHRSPPPSPQVPVLLTTTHGATATSKTSSSSSERPILLRPRTPREDTTATSKASSSSSERPILLRPRTPREEDRVLKSRYDDEDDSDENEDIDNDEDDHQHAATATTDAYEEAKLKAKQRQERMRKYASRLEEFKSSLPQEQEQQQQENNNKSALHTNPGSPSRLSSLPSDVVSILQQQESLSPLTLTLKPTVTTDHETQSVGPGLSDLSQSTNHYKQQQHEEEVQRGVERVLLAILERANTSSSRSRARSEPQQPQQQQAAAAPVSVSVPASVQSQSKTRTGTMLQAETAEMDNVLLQAMEELLGQVTSASASGSQASVGGRSKQDNLSSNLARQTNSSIVDELLAEDEWILTESTTANATRRSRNENGTITIPSPSSGMAMLGSPSSSCYPQSQFTSSDHTHQHKEEKKFESTEEPLSEESTPFQGQQQEPGSQQDSQNYSDMMNNCLLSSQENEDADDEDIEDAQDVDDSYQEGEESEEQADHDALDRVLGPLSKRSGGTTGVVLDLQNSCRKDEDEEESTVFSSVIKEAESVISYVASVMSPERTKEDVCPSPPKDKYSLDDRDDDDEGDDVEAMELMKTLCAHLLPFGVVQSNQLQETIPTWDEDNSTEAGYRIIRLSKAQLRRVEHSFESMIQNLKSNSETALEGYDANFVKELQEAERLLDDEERRLKAVEKAHDIVQQSNAKIQLLAHSGGFSHNKEDDDGDDSDKDSVTDVGSKSHADFPGIKSAGHGEMGDLEYFSLPIIFKSHVTGFEPTKEMVLEPGNIVAGQYLVESELGTAAFSTAYRCIDLSSEEDGEDDHQEVCLKVIKNTKDFFDQSLDEIKILELLRQTGKCNENYILEMKTFFYHREHLIIVTELLRQNLFEFGKFILDNDEEPYFTLPRLAYITRQCLVALRFVHNLGLVHSDVKPENILLGSYSRSQVKLIDFGSSCYLTDRQSSYIQSRSYRAPEVVLGLPYDGKIDIWSLGCVVAEMFTGEVTFQNDSIVSMLSRIEAICGSFPRHMIAQGRQSGRFFTKSGLLFETVDGSEDSKNTPDDSGSESNKNARFDIFQPKSTNLSSRLGFDAELMDGFSEANYRTKPKDPERQEQQMFTDFISRVLTIDPDGRLSAEEALEHPWIKYAEGLTEMDIKYPNS